MPREALPPCPEDALHSFPNCHLSSLCREAEPWHLTGTPREKVDIPSWEKTWDSTCQVLLNCQSMQTFALQEYKFICLKCKVKQSFTIFRTSTGRVNSSGLYNCLAHYFGFELCSLSSQMSCCSRWFTSLPKTMESSSKLPLSQCSLLSLHQWWP